MECFVTTLWSHGNPRLPKPTTTAPHLSRMWLWLHKDIFFLQLRQGKNKCYFIRHDIYFHIIRTYFVLEIWMLFFINLVKLKKDWLEIKLEFYIFSRLRQYIAVIIEKICNQELFTSSRKPWQGDFFLKKKIEHLKASLECGNRKR